MDPYFRSPCSVTEYKRINKYIELACESKFDRSIIDVIDTLCPEIQHEAKGGVALTAFIVTAI